MKVRILSDIERGAVLVDEKPFSEVRVGYATAMLSTGKHHIDIRKNSDDGEWEFSGQADIEVVDGGNDQAMVVDVQTNKQPTAKRSARLASEEAKRSRQQKK